MLDPSLIVAKQTLNKTFALIERLQDNFSFYLPGTFVALVEKRRISVDSPLFKFFLQKAIPAHPRNIVSLLDEYSGVINSFDPQPKEIEKHNEFFRSLSRRERDKQISRIILEEWIFLQEYSWLVSRTKIVFNKFMDAGGVCLLVGKKYFEKLVKKTIGKEFDPIITKADILRAICKWIAVAGEEIVKTKINMPLGLNLAINFFILFDPKGG